MMYNHKIPRYANMLKDPELELQAIKESLDSMFECLRPHPHYIEIMNMMRKDWNEVDSALARAIIVTSILKEDYEYAAERATEFQTKCDRFNLLTDREDKPFKAKSFSRNRA